MENQPKPVQSDEIDLGVLFAKIGDFFKSIGLSFIRFLALLRSKPIENKVLFFGLIVAGGVLAASYGLYVRKKYYESTMILSSNYLNLRIVESAIEKINLLAGENDSKGLARALMIPDSIAKDVVKLSAVPFLPESELLDIEILKEQLKNLQADKKNEKIIEQVVQKLEIENRHAFQLTVRILRASSTKILQEALVNFFRNNDYIKKRIEITKLNALARKEKLVNESEKLDSLKGVIYSNYKSMAEQSRQGSNNVILSDRAVTDPIQIYNQDLAIYNEIQSIDRQLYLQPDFEVVDGFTEFSEPASDSIPNMVVIGIIVGIGAFYLLIALFAFNNYLKEFE
jgi:hypothetical protein